MTGQGVTIPYDSKVFNQLPSIHASNEEFNNKNALRFVNEVLSHMLIKHELTYIFGVLLVHRHAEIGYNERLVDRNGVVTPWKFQNPEDFEPPVAKSQSVIFPKSWKLTNCDKWMPYEFEFGPATIGKCKAWDLNNAQYQPFLAEFAAAIKSNKLENVLGLSLWPGDDFRGGLEFSQGTTNIWLKPGEYSDVDVARSIETQWYFNEHSKKYKCICACVLAPSGTHVGGHSHIIEWY